MMEDPLAFEVLLAKGRERVLLERTAAAKLSSVRERLLSDSVLSVSDADVGGKEEEEEEEEGRFQEALKVGGYEEKYSTIRLPQQQLVLKAKEDLCNKININYNSTYNCNSTYSNYNNNNSSNYNIKKKIK